MTLIIQKPTTSKLILAKDYVGIDDPDAAVYIAAVEAADETASPSVGALETATKVAIHSFVKGCKNDGIWPAIKASCILAGARTLTGALVPLAGAAPTAVGFASPTYSRTTGLLGDGTSYLDSNRNNNSDPQNSCHNAAYSTIAGTGGVIGVATAATGSNTLTAAAHRSRTGSAQTGFTLSSGFTGHSRSNESNYAIRNAGSSNTITRTSDAPASANILIFRSANQSGSHRLAFYSIGESLDLALLDARVTDLINAFAAAIP